MKRCFVALALPDATARALRQTQDDLASLFDADAPPRWVPRDNLHLTLTFLGQVSDAQLGPLKRALADIAAAGQSLHVELLGLGVFGGLRPRSVYADVGLGKGEILALMATVETAARALGFVVEHVSRVPHVTLARLNRHVDTGCLDPLMGQDRPVAFGPLDGSAIMLFESVLGAGGARYMPLLRLPFQNLDG
jgi:2'-5' RNA ligase